MPLGVTDQTPTIAKLLTLTPVAVQTDVTVTIPVPLSVLNQALVFMPPGVNYSIGVGVGFNGRKLIPTEDASDYIYGSTFPHVYPAGWQVQNGVDIFFRKNNTLPHRIYVALYLDRRPTQKESSSFLVLPS